MQSVMPVPAQAAGTVIATITSSEFLHCILDKDTGKFECTVRDKFRDNAVLHHLGFFDDVEKDPSMHGAGNNREFGMINAYPRSDEVAYCFVTGENTLACRVIDYRLLKGKPVPVLW